MHEVVNSMRVSVLDPCTETASDFQCGFWVKDTYTEYDYLFSKLERSSYKNQKPFGHRPNRLLPGGLLRISPARISLFGFWRSQILIQKFHSTF